VKPWGRKGKRLDRPEGTTVCFGNAGVSPQGACDPVPAMNLNSRITAARSGMTDSYLIRCEPLQVAAALSRSWRRT